MIPEKFRKYFLQMLAMHFMACILLLIYAVYLIADWAANWMELAGLVPATLATLWILLKRSKLLKQVEVNQVLRLFEIGFLGIASSFFYHQQLWLGALLFGAVGAFLLVLLLVEYQMFSERFIELNEREIILPQLFFKRRIPWQNIENVILKYNLLTIEFKDNNFAQQQVFHKYDEYEMQLFDDFLKRQIL